MHNCTITLMMVNNLQLTTSSAHKVEMYGYNFIISSCANLKEALIASNSGILFPEHLKSETKLCLFKPSFLPFWQFQILNQ